MPINFGDAPGWISAIATSGAFGATTWLLYIESGRRQDERVTGRRADASRVSRWLHKDDSGRLSLFVSNNSGAPVYYIELHLKIDRIYYSPYHLSTIPPGSPSGSDTINSWLRSQLPQQRSDYQIGLDMLFADSAGVNWVRDLNGALLELEQRDRTGGTAELSRYRIAKTPQRGRLRLRRK